MEGGLKYIGYRKKGGEIRADSARFQRFLDKKARKGEGYLTGRMSNVKKAMLLPMNVLQQAVKFKLKNK